MIEHLDFKGPEIKREDHQIRHWEQISGSCSRFPRCKFRKRKLEDRKTSKTDMKTHWKITISIFLFLSIINQVVAQDVTKAHMDSLNLVVEKYYDLNLKMFQAGSTMDDIDRIFQLFTEDFEYVHPKYGGTYTREDLYNGSISNQKNGRYDGSVVNIKTTNKIIGLNAVVVQKSFVERKDGQIKVGEPQMTLFEFENGKISRIFEYW